MAGIPEGGFQNSGTLRQWLQGLPDERVSVCSRAIASRAALRVLPLVGRSFSIPKFEDLTWRLPIAVFRANAVASIAPATSGIAYLRSAIGAEKAADFRGDPIANNFVGFSRAARDAAVAFASASAVFRFMNMSIAVTARSAATGAAVVVDNAARAASIVSDTDTHRKMDRNALAIDIWSAATADSRTLELGLSSIDIMYRPLWPGEAPAWWEKERNNLDIALATAPSSDLEIYPQTNWSIWSEWYRSRVFGTPSFGLPRDIADEIDRRIALGDGREDFWDRPPEAINAEIAGWVEEARRKLTEVDPIDPPSVPPEVSPAQDAGAIVMGGNALGQVDRMPTPPEQRLLDTPAQRRDYRAARDDALELQAWGVNRLGPRLAPQIDNLLGAMPEDLAHAAVFDLWRGLNRLRRTHNAHEAVGNAEGDDARLDPAAAEELGHLLDGLNNFAFGDPRLRERDQRRIAPQDRAAIEDERRLVAPIIADALDNEEIATEAAREAVDAEAANAADAGDSEHGKQAVEQAAKTERNFVAALISAASRAASALAQTVKGEAVFSWKEFRAGAYRAVGAAAATVTIAAGALTFPGAASSVFGFVVRHATALKEYAGQVFQNPKIIELIDWIARVFS